MWRKKIGLEANGGLDFTKKLKEMLRKKKGFRANGGFGCTNEKRELILKNYKKKRGLSSTMDFILYTVRCMKRPIYWRKRYTHDNITMAPCQCGFREVSRRYIRRISLRAKGDFNKYNLLCKNRPGSIP